MSGHGNSASLLDTLVSPARMDELIEMPFGMWALGFKGDMYYCHWGMKGQILGGHTWMDMSNVATADIFNFIP